MIIKLVPQRRDDLLEVVKNGNSLSINGEEFDLSQIHDGDTLPQSAIKSEWFAADVEMVFGDLVVTLLLPNPVNFSQAQAYPVPLFNVPDGVVELPAPLPTTFVTAQVDQ
ncbi:hypothetical protein LOY49_12625 [Pseudomonas atacamensis]|uniref:hypothetical protein n=1 Tax=Pseudomonas atacamensis TaxID=2565368 RepID=UPI002160F17A|nr:hypothetical protein [Pseudomonas atacamensis]UVK96127.1 hypothetical protein LOY49_12625 [Pseudomonas atacamensis]